MLEFIAGLMLGAGGTYLLNRKDTTTTTSKNGVNMPTFQGTTMPGGKELSPADCTTLMQTYIASLPDPAKGVLLSAIATKNVAGLEVAATAVQGVNPSLAACIRAVAKS